MFPLGQNMAIVSGIEELDDGGLFVYLGQRGRRVGFILDDPEAQEQMRRAWADTTVHVLTPVPAADLIMSRDHVPPPGPRGSCADGCPIPGCDHGN